MKKAFVILAAFCALTAAAAEKTAAEQLVEMIWNVNSESTFTQAPLFSASKNNHYFSVDVACDIATARYGFSEPPTVVYVGQPFILKGYIYPAGTLEANDINGGVAEGGGPQWPDQQIGEWICRGYIWVPAAVTTQVFYMGEDQIITDSFEVSNPANVNIRPITGGTGEFSHARGESSQQVVGVNGSQAPNFVFGFSFQRDIQFKGE